MSKKLPPRDRNGLRRLAATLTVVGAVRLALMGPVAQSAELPVPCVSGACGPFVTSGQAGAVVTGNTLTIGQTSERAILNWASFNIGADGTVVFNHAAGKDAVTLNRIHDANPSQIFGTLRSTGQIYLINTNGIVFGETARVNVGGLLASTLDMTDTVFNRGLLSAMPDGAAASQQSALRQTGAEEATISIKPGAKLTTNEAGQRVLLAASKVENAGDITAVDGGQVVLAAGEKVYVAASDDPKLRGLLVEVDGGGSVTNTGSVMALNGNITAVGLAVNQNGRMSASTSVSENGSIRLLARDSVTLQRSNAGTWTFASVDRGGELTVGRNSVTRIDPDTADTGTAVDDQAQQPSTVELVGKRIEIEGQSSIIAAGGTVTAIAASNPGAPRTGADDPGAGIHVAAGALIDVSGSTANTAVTRNLVTVELRANELADSPQQRDGPLRGSTVVIDAREGTPLANVSGAIALLKRDILERTSEGGTVSFDSAGDVIVAKDAVVDVSGGVVNYAGGTLRTSQLIRSDGSVVDIGKASADDTYVAVLSPSYRRVDDRWGVIETISAPGIGRYESGYVEGRSAGTVQFLGSSMVLNGNFVGSTLIGTRQRELGTLPLGGQFIVGVTNTTGPHELPSAGDRVVGARADRGRRFERRSSRRPSAVPELGLRAHRRLLRVRLASDRSITLADDLALDLGPGGALTLQAPRLQLDSDITAAGGSITATALALNANSIDPGLFVGAGARFDVGGNWVNDSLVPLGVEPLGAIVRNAGLISLTQSVDVGRLEIGHDVSLLANGGAWLRQTGAIAGGKGGDIRIVARGGGTALPAQVETFGAGIVLEAFGTELAAGGKLTLQVPRFRLSDQDTWLGAQQIGASTKDGGTLSLGTSLFTDHGFSAFTLIADGLPLDARTDDAVAKIASGSHVNLQASNRQLRDGASSVASGASIASLTDVSLAEAIDRGAVSLSLQSQPTAADQRTYGDVVVEDGAQITGDAGSSFEAISQGSIEFAGDLRIAGGTVAMSTLDPKSSVTQAYVPLDLHLAKGAKLDVSGGTIEDPNDLGLRQGRVVAGGNVTLTAKRGTLTADKDTSIDASGAAATFDFLPEGGSRYEPRIVTSTGGRIGLQAAEDIAFEGTVLARGGALGGYPQ